MSEKIQLVVLNENILGYRDPKNNFLNILAASIRSGANFTDRVGDIKFFTSNKDLRFANEEDFDFFMVSGDGYRNDPNYQYDRRKLTDRK